jgi:hypothetical protein
MRAPIVAFVVAVSAAGVVGTAPAASAMPASGSATSTCWTAPAATHDDSGRGLWSYVHTVSWCGDQNKITSTVPPHIEVSTIDDTCVWQGVTSQRAEFRAESWITHSMGEFACTGEDGTPQQVNPWMTVTVHPNGSHDAVSGVAG